MEYQSGMELGEGIQCDETGQVWEMGWDRGYRKLDGK